MHFEWNEHISSMQTVCQLLSYYFDFLMINEVFLFFTTLTKQHSTPGKEAVLFLIQKR